MKKETVETINDTLAKIKESGLGIGLIDPSSPQAKEHCAYQSCDDAVVFTMEDLPVCQKHAVSLMHCFIPDCKTKE